MYNNKMIAVVVPAFNEEKQIGHVLKNMPDFVDRIVVINDCSTDKTREVVLEFINDDRKKRGKKIDPKQKKITQNIYNAADIILQKAQEGELKFFPASKIINEHPETDRIILIDQLQNYGNGKAIARGYKWAQDHDIDCTVVMDGDGQMDPSEMESIIQPIIEEGVDYVKGNRLIHRSAWLVIPQIRYFGNSILSILTKIASGYWHISDAQCGYTAISIRALRAIRIYKIFKSYGWPNDMLIKLNIAFCTIKEVEIKPVYQVGEKSKMKIYKVIPTVSWLLFKSFFRRLWIKYFFRDFHPLFLLYNFSFLLGLICMPYAYKVFQSFVHNYKLSLETLFAFSFLSITSFQSLLFAMWMDILDNERLHK